MTVVSLFCLMMGEPTLWETPEPEKPGFGRFAGWRANRWPWTLRIDRPKAKTLSAWDEVWIEVTPRDTAGVDDDR